MASVAGVLLPIIHCEIREHDKLSVSNVTVKRHVHRILRYRVMIMTQLGKP